MRSRSWTEKEFIEAVKNSRSKTDVLRKLNLKLFGGNYNTVNKYIKILNLDISHFSIDYSKNRFVKSKIPLSEILIKNSDYLNTWHLRNRLIDENVLEYCCSICGIDDWQENHLSLHLDHINGIRNDNRLENLRLLCPNCHSQTETYAGKKLASPKRICPECGGRKKNGSRICIRCKSFEEQTARDKYGIKLREKKKTNKCLSCGKPIKKENKRCMKCHLANREKIFWPPTSELIKMVEKTSYVATAKNLGVSDNAIRKRIKNHPEQTFPEME